jgi:hypothetical protein
MDGDCRVMKGASVASAALGLQGVLLAGGQAGFQFFCLRLFCLLFAAPVGYLCAPLDSSSIRLQATISIKLDLDVSFTGMVDDPPPPSRGP